MKTNQTSSGDSTYALGHVDTEIHRLLLQGRMHAEFTEHALRLAGLRSGMRVLDMGCGPGDVSFIAARLVGPTGTVLGVDASADVIEVARTRAAEQGVTTVRFAATVIADVSLDEPVDAVIGRMILIHLPDPIAALRHLGAMVRPGGLVAFCEPDISAARIVPDLPLWWAVKDAVDKAFEGAGSDPTFGAKLHTVFRRAGLAAPRLTLGAPLGAADDEDILTLVVETWRSMFLAAQRLGLVPDELADVDTLAQRLRNEAAGAEAIAIMPALICASTQVYTFGPFDAQSGSRTACDG
jgi:ubiquinone/menaquinone biosynthesis C-methylase UbiE